MFFVVWFYFGDETFPMEGSVLSYRGVLMVEKIKYSGLKAGV